MAPQFPHLFSPIAIKGVELRNRIAVSGHFAGWWVAPRLGRRAPGAIEGAADDATDEGGLEPGYVAEKSRIRLALDATTGDVTSLYDKRVGCELVDMSAGGDVAVFAEDPAGTALAAPTNVAFLDGAWMAIASLGRWQIGAAETPAPGAGLHYPRLTA